MKTKLFIEIRNLRIRRALRAQLTLLFILPLALAPFQNCSGPLHLTISDSSLSSSSVSGKGLNRPSNLEYQNSLRDALANQFSRTPGSPTVDQVLQDLSGPLAELPGDYSAVRLGSDQMVTPLSSARFTAYVDIAYAVSNAIASNSTWLAQFSGGCATDNATFSDDVCISNFIAKFGLLLFRSPPSTDEVTDLKLGATNWQTLIGRMLVHPRFIFHLEADLKQAQTTLGLTPSGYEIEARLAALYWKSTPDLQGLAVAASGQLSTDDGLKTEIDRLLNSQKAKDVMWEFWKQYLAASRVPNSYGASSAASLLLKIFASPLNVTDFAFNSDMNTAVINEGRQFVEYFTWSTNGKLMDVFSSPLMFTTNANLASIYGVAARANDSAPPTADGSGHFKGILSRAIVTQQKPSGNYEPNHIQRGVMLVSNIIGVELGQPANFAEQQQAAKLVPVGASTRVQTATMTGLTQCASCHSSINPAGFALAHYDTFGRYITVEDRYNPDGSATATVIASNPIDSSGTIQISGVNYAVADLPGLVDALAKSDRLYLGFAKYYFRFAFGRADRTAADALIIKNLSDSLKTKSLREAISGIALQRQNLGFL